MASAEDCERVAAECLALAQQAKTPDHKARLIEMAQAWKELGDKLRARDDPSGSRKNSEA